MRGLNNIRKPVPPKARIIKDKRKKREQARVKKFIKDEVTALYEDLSADGYHGIIREH